MISSISRLEWGEYNGENVYLYKISQPNGSFVEVTNFGARIVSICVPDRYGKIQNVVLGFDSLQAYLQDTCYLGATLGRVANRIRDGKFFLNGEEYILEQNDGPNSNHSGSSGLHNQVFECEMKSGNLRLSYDSIAGQGGFPGTVNVVVSYDFSCENVLSVRYEGNSDSATPLDMSNHTYFNLSGQSSKILDHHLSIPSVNTLEMGPDYIPTGKINYKARHVFYGQQINAVLNQNAIKGLNSYYVFSNKLDKHPILLSHYPSGRFLEITTSSPGVMLYTGDYLTTTSKGHFGEFYAPYNGLCLECHSYPNSVNLPEFPSIILDSQRRYNEYVVMKFYCL